MNRITLEPTKFENQRSGHITLGFRMHDDYSQAYDNTWNSIPDDDMDVLSKVIDESSNADVCAMLEFILEHNTCIYIGDLRYGWDQISHLWER